MAILDSFNGLFKSASSKAKRTYSHAKLDLKIKAYEKEIYQLEASIGRLIYEAWSNSAEADKAILNEYLENIKNINFRINRLNKAVAELKKYGSQEKEQPTAADKPEQQDFTVLSKKESDIKISRTEDGIIRVLRYCPSCGTANASKAEVCQKCEAVLKNN